MGIGAALGGLAGGLLQSSAASKAASAQERAADRQYALQERVYEDTTERYAPYLGAGNTALDAYMYELGLGGRPTMGGTAPQITTIPGTAGAMGRDTSGLPFTAPDGTQFGLNAERMGGQRATDGGGLNFGTQTQGQGTPTRYQVGGQTFNTMEEAQAWARANPTGGSEYQGFQATPGYQFQLDQGLAATNALAGARGGLNSGRTLQALQDYGSGLANQEYGGYMNRLAGLTDMGMGAAGNQAAAGNAFATGAGNALGAAGNAQAAGAIGVGNAWSGALQNGISSWQYQNALNQGRTA